MIVIDEQNRIVDFNPSAQQLLNHKNFKIGDKITEAGVEISTRMQAEDTITEFEILTDPRRCMELTTTTLKDNTGVVVGKMGILRDVTENHELRKQLQELATHDVLTGLPNRRLFFDRIHCTISEAKRNQTKFALFSLDLDLFKKVNDKFGHLVGDQVLIEMGTRIANSLRAIDTVSRFGGDEFMILVQDVHSQKDAAVRGSKDHPRALPALCTGRI